METKFCWNCTKDKPETEFKERQDFRKGICEKCIKEQERLLNQAGYQIIQKDRKPHWSDWHGGMITIIDVYIKNSRSHFIKGYYRSDPPYEIQIFEKINQFIATKGNYISFYGGDSPLALIKEIKDTGDNFGHAYNCELSFSPSMRVWDFHGNLERVSHAFMFRIYKKRYAWQLAEAIKGMENITIILNEGRGKNEMSKMQ